MIARVFLFISILISVNIVTVSLVIFGLGRWGIEIENLAESHFVVIYVIYGVIVLEHDGAHFINVATVEQKNFTEVLSRFVDDGALMKEFITGHCVVLSV